MEEMLIAARDRQFIFVTMYPCPSMGSPEGISYRTEIFMRGKLVQISGVHETIRTGAHEVRKGLHAVSQDAEGESDWKMAIPAPSEHNREHPKRVGCPGTGPGGFLLKVTVFYGPLEGPQKARSSVSILPLLGTSRRSK